MLGLGLPLSNTIKSGFLPTQLEGNVLWLAADMGTTLADGNTTVDAWQDQSGNGNDASAPAAINRPLYVENALNGKPVLRGDGVNSNLTGSGLSVSGDQELTIFVVSSNLADYADAGGGTAIVIGNDSGNERDRRIFSYCYETASYDSIRLLGGSVLFDNSMNNNFYVNSFEYEGSGVAYKAWLNGVQRNVISSSAGLHNFTSGEFSVFGSGGLTPGGLFTPFNGDIAEILVYNRALLTSERNQVEQYLSDKYAITLA